LTDFESMGEATMNGWHTGRQETVTRIFADAVAADPEKLFVDFDRDRRTYAQFDHDSTAFAQGLRALGVQRAEPVAALLDNTIDVALYWIGTVKLGGIVAALNNALKGEFLRNQLDICQARVLVAESDYVERLTVIIDQLPHLRYVVYRGDKPQVVLPNVQLVPIGQLYQTRGEPIQDENKPGDIAALIFTSGTTGPSKGCAISHNYVINQARQIIETDDRQPQEVAWSCLPFFHFNAVGCTFLTAAILGGSAYFALRFSLSGFWKDIERSGATAASLLGVMIPLVAQQADTPEMLRCKGQLRLVAGAPFPAELQRIYRERFGVRRAGSNCYGTTEACLLTMVPYGVEPKPGTSGVRSPDFDVRIVDDNDSELPPGVPGEVIARPLRPHVMFEGFYRQPEATVKIFRNMWYHSGDIGKFDEDGFFHFVDRKKDYLRRGGENISMFELERTFLQHPEVSEVAAHAVPSKLMEDDVKITLLLKSGARLTEQELCQWSLDRVPYYAVPRYIEFRSELPKTPTGKIEKFLLREQGCTPQTWDREAAGMKIAKR
jgi:crotonobetaine/carnitine-CoA ligase